MQDDFERAMVDPAALFATPEAVLQRSDYSGEQKRLISAAGCKTPKSCRWRKRKAWRAGSRR
jgi:hypothetical protein